MLNLSATDLALYATMLPLALTSLSMTLAGLLSQDKWSVHVNDAIAVAFVLIAVVVDIFLTGQFIGGGLLVEIALIAATLSIVLASCKPLQRWTMFLQQTVLVLQQSGFHVLAQAPVETTVATSTTSIPLPDSVPPSVLVTTNTIVASTPASNADGLTTEIPKSQFIKPTTGGLIKDMP